MLARTSLGRGNERFTARRRVRRRRVAIASAALLLLLAGGIVYELRQDAFRISRIELFGGDEALRKVASTTMQGYYLGLVPRNSTFFFSRSRIRAEFIKRHPEIAAVSFFRKGFTGLSIKISDRVAIARWCGLGPTEGVDPYCYSFDASGVIFAASASTTETVNPFVLYAPLANDAQEPLRATILYADQLPHVFDFSRQLVTLGSSVTHIIIKSDEVNHYTKSGTRVTYVLGREQDAYTALASAKENINLADGSIEYIDLRFDGKVYVKRK